MTAFQDRGRWRSSGVLRALLYVVLIVLCVLMAPEEPLKFIYTEF